MTPEELKEIESQLSFPNGENGIRVANMMNETNIGMTLSTIKSLNIKSNNIVLEIGHGNCAHLFETLKQAKNIQFFGCEISKTMQEEAIRVNKNLSQQNSIDFQLYNGENIPFQDANFDRIMTVNTIYFWKETTTFLKEIHRVLKPKGVFVLTFAKKEFMEELPFIKDKFQLFDNQKVKELIQKTDFELVEILNKEDTVKSKSGALVHRKYSVVVLKK